MENNCKNCEATLHGPYCAQCGQKQQNQRLSLKMVLHSAYESITNVEQGFWHTVLGLTTRPGKVAQDYLSGKRKPYFPPIRYLIVLIAVNTLILISTGYYDMQYEAMQEWQKQQLTAIDSQQKTTALTEDQQLAQSRIQELTKNYLNIIALLSFPFIGLVSYLGFRRRSYNYAEHLVVCAYWGGQSALYSMLVMLLLMLSPIPILYAFTITLMVNILYYMLGYHQLFQVSYGKAFLKSLLTNIGGFLLFFISFFVLTILFTFLYFVIFK